MGGGIDPRQMGRRRLWASPVFVSLVLLCGALAGVEPAPPGTADALVARAAALGLADDPAWLTLLHVERGLRGRRSLIDDPAFFLDPGGARDPGAELSATIRLLVTGAAAGVPDPAHPGSGSSVAARFPARCAWLSRRLGLPPPPLDPELAAAFDEYRPSRATLVFAAGYLTSPASMFGHTLLLVEGSERSRLLAQAINYAALVPDGAGCGPLLAAQGLFGVYRGWFSVLPYHRKVQEYNDLDQRDLWEYRLTLDADEVRTLLLHAWELRGIWSDYWFFDENCSFNLLFLLQAARPDAALTAQAGAWVIPADTVRWAAGAGLIAGATYRPSRAARVGAAMHALGPEASARAVAVARGTMSASAAASEAGDAALRAQILDLAGECLHALAGRGQIGLGDYRQRLHRTLAERAALGEAPPLPAAEPPIRPDQGHASGRFALGGGVDDGIGFASLGLRAAHHDLLDPPAGYPAGSEVTMGEVEARWYERRPPALHRLDVLKLTAIEPWEPLFRRWSWGMRIGAVHERMGAVGTWTHQAAAGIRCGLAAGGEAALAWAVATAEMRAWDRTRGRGRGWSAAPGAEIGAAIGAGPLRLLPRAAGGTRLLGERGGDWELGLGARAACAWGAVDFQAAVRERWRRREDEIGLRLMAYF